MAWSFSLRLSVASPSTVIFSILNNWPNLMLTGVPITLLASSSQASALENTSSRVAVFVASSKNHSNFMRP